MKWMVLPFWRALDFQGRSRRLEYWAFQGFLVLALVSSVGLVHLIQEDGADELGGAVGAFVIALFMLPAVAVTVRRFHDQNRSGFWFLMHLAPYVGSLVVLVFMCIEGERKVNRFGKDPIENNEVRTDTWAWTGLLLTIFIAALFVLPQFFQ